MPLAEYVTCPQIGQLFRFGCGTRGSGFLLFIVSLNVGFHVLGVIALEAFLGEVCESHRVP